MQIAETLSAIATPSAATRETSEPDEIEAAAKDFEAVFVRQMLQHAGLAEAFGTGEGGLTDSLSGFLLDQLADDIVEQGGFGIAEKVYAELKIKAEGETVDGAATGVRL